MRKTILALASIAALAAFTPASSFAQGFSVDTPVGGVRVGEPRYGHDNGWHRGWDHRGWRDRDVYLRDRDCRTVTVERDGYVKRIRRCD